MSQGPDIILWTIIALAGVLAAWQGYRGFIGLPAKGRPRCPKCWYDMTGAPSRVCPECGYTAKSERQQHKRRRYGRSFIVAMAMISLVCYLAVPVRDRMKRLNEPLRTAVIPTTALIGMSACEIKPDWYRCLPNRVFAANSLAPGVYDWQVWLEVHALHRRLLFPAVRRNQYDDDLLTLSKLTDFNEAACIAWAQLLSEHPDPSIRLRIALTIVSLKRAGHAPEKFSSPQIQGLVWAAFDAGKLKWLTAEMILQTYGMNSLQRLSDDELLAQLKILNQTPGNEFFELSLQEMVRRKLTKALPPLKEMLPQGSVARDLLTRNAINRLSGLPDPVTIRLMPHDELPDFFWIELSLTDRSLDELPFGSVADPSIVYLPITAVLHAGTLSKVKPWGSERLGLASLHRNVPIKLLVQIPPPPPNTSVRVRMCFEYKKGFPVSLAGATDGVPLLPESNELKLSTQPELVVP